MSSPRKPWTVQWHVGADGTVIRQRSKGDQPHQQLYGRYTTRRRLGIAELDALDDRLARDKKVIGGFVRGLVVLTTAAFACFVVGVVLGWLGVDAARYLVAPGLIVLVGAMICAGGGHGLMMSRWHRAWGEAGFESPNPVTMSAREAHEIVGAPGAVSGRRTRVERA